jgi:tripeptide aminopeptidase
MAFVAASVGAHAQPLANVHEIAAGPSVKSALASIAAAEPATIADQVRFCEIPAPPFGESARAESLRKAFLEAGLTNVRLDRAGNVLGERRGLAARPHVVVASHLDTVFPKETDVTVRREGAVLRGPGIGDNCRGLAVLVAIARAMRGARVQTPGSVTFVANVGEEGLGDLRGVKAIFGETLEGRVDRFVSIDGGGVGVTHVSVGSYRYRVTFKGPGGHSFGAFGLANPANAMGRAIARIAELKVPARPLTTFNVGRVGGGTSVNSIPFEAWMEVDLRSSDQAALKALDADFHRAVDQAVIEENRRWGRPDVVSASKDLVGDRPAGSIPATSPIVQTVREAGRVLGLNVPLSEGSTDANVPMSLGIPSVTIGGGGSGSGAHALSETFDTTEAWKGAQHALLVTIALAR